MKATSARAKGQRFERFIAKEIEKAGLGKAGRESASGAGFRKGDIASNLPFLIEAKNQKRYSWWSFIDQAKDQADAGNFSPEKWALVVRDPRTAEKNPDCYVVMDFWEWLKLLKKDSVPLIKKPDKELKWKLQRLKNYAQSVIKDL